VDGCQSWKLAQILLQFAPETRTGIRHLIPARVSGKCVMSITHFLITCVFSASTVLCYSLYSLPCRVIVKCTLVE